MGRVRTFCKPMLLVAAVTACLLSAAPVANAQAGSLSASFRGVQKHNDPLCQGGAVLCGTGSVAGYGAASYSGFPIALGPVEGSCRTLTAITVIDLSDGSGSLTAQVSGTLCYPGKSYSAPGAAVSFGNPFRINADYEIIGGDGVFAGAGGTGAATLRGAGAQSRLAVSGSLDF